MGAESSKRNDADVPPAHPKDDATANKAANNPANLATQKLADESWSGLEKKTPPSTIQPFAYIELPNPYVVAYASIIERAGVSQGSATDRSAVAGNQPFAQQEQSTPSNAFDSFAGAGDYVKQAIEGAAVTAYTAVTEHPKDTAIMVAEGAVVGVALVAAAPVIAAAGAGAAVVGGVALAADATIVGLTAFGAAKSAVDFYQGGSESSASADVLMHKSMHTQAEIEAAQKDVRDKMGSASLEVAGTALMTFGALGAGAKVFGMLKSGRVIVSLDAVNAGAISSLTETSLSGSTEASVASLPRAVVRNSPELPARTYTRTATSSELPDLVLAHEAPPEPIRMASAEKPAKGNERAEKSVIDDKPSLLPPGSVEHFGRRLGDFIADREKIFNIEKAELKIERQSNELMDFHAEVSRLVRHHNFTSNGEGMTLSMDRLGDVVKSKEFIDKHPEVKPQYRSYLRTIQEQDKLIARRDEELVHRRDGIAKIVNEEAQHLFPGGVTPEFTIARLNPKSNAEATYNSGKISISDKDLQSHAFDRLYASKLPSYLIHEMKHGEQDGLLVRKGIDSITGGDTTGRALTPTERDAIRASLPTRPLPDELIDKINQKRNGLLLSQDELERSQAIEKGFESHNQQGFAHVANRERLAQLELQLSFIEPDYSSNILRHPDDLEYLFRGEVPEPVAALVDEYSKIPKNEDGYPEYEETFEHRVEKILTPAFKEAIARTKRDIADGWQEYRNWEHEKESWSTHQEVEQRLKSPEHGMLNERLESLLRMMFAEPVEPLTVDRVSNVANRELFTEIEEMKSSEDPSVHEVYDQYLSAIADETGDLLKAGVMQRFKERVRLNLGLKSSDAGWSAYEIIDDLLGRHGEPEIELPASILKQLLAGMRKNDDK